MSMKHALRCTTAISLGLVLSTAYAAGDTVTSSTGTSSTKTQTSEPLTGKQKATAIGATTGAVAGAVVGGPVGAVVGAGVGGYVGHEGTDANGHVPTSHASDSTIRRAQAALNEQGYNVGTVDGRWGPNTHSAVRRFQAKSGLTENGTLDSSTLKALGVNG
jgi:murein L,D-transpeptidase YcbB/YkuD